MDKSDPPHPFWNPSSNISSELRKCVGKTDIGCDTTISYGRYDRALAVFSLICTRTVKCHPDHPEPFRDCSSLRRRVELQFDDRRSAIVGYALHGISGEIAGIQTVVPGD